MKKKIIATALAISTLSLGVLAGCFNTTPSVTSIEKSHTIGLVDYYTITYSDGTTSQFTVTNGRNGTDGEDAQDVTAEDVYETYKTMYPEEELTFKEFCEKYLTVNTDGNDSIAALNSCLLSCAKVYTVFHEKKYSDYGRYLGVVETAYCGSSVIYKTDEQYTYFLTNYHVIYDENAAAGYDNFTEKTWVYMYGSEYAPVQDKNTYQYSIYEADTYAIACDYIGGSIAYDVAVLRASTDDVKRVNPQFKPVEISYDYAVGESTYAVGNPDDGGISVTEGIVSVDSDNITLAIDGTSRSYRSIRTDTALTHGSSGGGLFNMKGELIGLNNAGDEDITSMNFAIPASVLTAVADGVLYYNAADSTVKTTFVTRLGVTVSYKNSRFVLDPATGKGDIFEETTVVETSANSLSALAGLQAGDIITSLTLNGRTTEITRQFKMTDVLLNTREGDTLIIGYTRGGTAGQSAPLTVRAGDLFDVDKTDS
ncbi:MAG: S1C family serine protease [Muribaculaceae bacterium]|nr:S1C family serine protease [Muribaculaceae bacterium]